MAQVPDFLTPYLSKLHPLIAEEIQFSGPTYQVKILDTKEQEELWTFIQLNPEREIADAFCSCQESEETGGCPHLALSYLSLFDKREEPLHEVFFHSFWKQMGEIWFKRYGLKVKGKGFVAAAHTEEGRELLNLIKGEKIAETEENSIKFSNLSLQELEDWRGGNPSKELLFELSGWANFSKQLMLQKSLQVFFQEIKGELPKTVHIGSPDFSIKSSLSLEDWERIIPTLSLGNLPVFNALKDKYQSITYVKGILKLVPHSRPKTSPQVISVGPWHYLPGKGFYPKRVQEETLKGASIGTFLDRYQEQLPLFLKLNKPPISLKYTLSFDEEGNLKISPYIFKRGDFQKTNQWGRWIHMPEKGFYQIRTEEEISSQINREDISDFVRHHSDWLNRQPGFQVHPGSIETQLTYHVDASGTLQFEPHSHHKKADVLDFGSWIHVKGEGFFNKTVVPIQLPIELGVRLRKDLVPAFIRHHLHELEQIPRFINPEEPFQRVGIEITLDEKQRICVEPRYQLKGKFAGRTYRLYEEWVYLEKEGFSLLPPAFRLPEKIQEPFWVAKDQVKEFIEKQLPQLQRWIQKIDERLIPPVTMRLHLDQLEEAPYHSWIINLHYETERGKIPLKTLLEGYRKKEKYLFLPEGRLDLSDERLGWIKRLKPQAILKNRLNISTLELLRLHAFEDITAAKDIVDLYREIVSLKRTPPFHPKELKSTLRPYQKIGAEWLFSLSNYLLGGLLCDEMGLGKTHQAMGVMAALRQMKPSAKFLVICPTSVLYHWQDKLQEFFPTLKVKTYHGIKRNSSLKRDYDLLLTTYGMLRSDIETLKKQHFNLAFYDEIQVAKNHRSKLYQALQKVHADVRFGLTGTPLENRLRELKALFDLVLPGYMLHESDYNRLIVRPIEKLRDMQKKSLLQRLTHPFVLRRKKLDVLSDLPEKTEAIAHCELSSEQDKLYREALLMQKQELLQDILDVKKAIPFLHVFSLLSRLKQICDHPALYLKKTDLFAKHHSGKWELFVELLKEARESQQKVVIYSQYLGMLDIIENYLKAEGIGFASLRGSTRDRKEQIDLFATDPSCEVFVASLKAAGLGIDLTAASVVIHYDRWWNAARENQATDRVHRYGQSKGVQVFKLVTKHTFEERIHQIIERKKDLMEEAIGVDDHEVMKTFTREELIELLQYSEISSKGTPESTI